MNTGSGCHPKSYATLWSNSWQRSTTSLSASSACATTVRAEKKVEKKAWSKAWAGLVAGERGTVLMVLKARGLQVSESQCARIDACDDLATLKGWAEAALTAATADDLFK